MTAWRTILTDSESLSGVAPVCPQQDAPSGEHAVWPGERDEHGVYDCCPHPHLETWSTVAAAELAEALTKADAEVCS